MLNLQTLVIAACISFFGPTSAFAEPLDSLMTVMTCLHSPHPTGVLVELTNAGLLGPRQRNGMDESCWDFQHEVVWSGMMFVAVCAISDEVAEIKKHSGIYWSGESQAPFTEVWLVTAASADELEAWAKSTLPEASFFEIDRPSLPGELSALSCSEWAFRS